MISVLMPVRNAAASLPAALTSLLSQTGCDFEVVAVNDGSDDRGATRDILAAAGRRDPRVRPIHRSHGGIVAALSAGLAVARGEYIARMDADDLCLPGRWNARPTTWTPTRRWGSCPAGPLSAETRPGPTATASICVGPTACLRPRPSGWPSSGNRPLPHPSVMFRTSLVRRFGGYRQGDFPEDYELWLRWLEAGVVMAKLPETCSSGTIHRVGSPGPIRATPRKPSTASRPAPGPATCPPSIRTTPRSLWPEPGGVTRRRAGHLLGLGRAHHGLARHRPAQGGQGRSRSADIALDGRARTRILLCRDLRGQPGGHGISLHLSGIPRICPWAEPTCLRPDSGCNRAWRPAPAARARSCVRTGTPLFFGNWWHPSHSHGAT